MDNSDQARARESIDLLHIAETAVQVGIAWSRASADLNLNLMVLKPGSSIAAHVNDQVDVLLLPIRGDGTATVEGHDMTLRPGACLVIEKGNNRSFEAGPEGLAYLLCHRRRSGLWPAVSRDPDAAV